MRISKMIRLRPRDDNSSIFYVMVVILFMASAFLGFIYSETGDFAMDVDDVLPYDIRISEHITFESPTTRLDATSYVGLNSLSLDDIDLYGIFEQSGQYIDQEHKYLAYSFYVKNHGRESFDVSYYMRLTEGSYWTRDSIRILIIEDDLIYTMYQKDEADIDNDNDIETYLFTSDTIVFRHVIKDFKVDEVRQFRVIMWFDQSDLNQESIHIGDLLKANMAFTVIYPTALVDSQSLSFDKPKNLWLNPSTICIIEVTLIYSLEDEVY